MEQMDILLSIKGTHTTEYDTDTIEFITSGTMTAEGDSYSISYHETEVTGMEGQTTTLYIEGSDRVVIHRTGDYESQLVLEKGHRNLSHYNTEAGPLLMSVSAHDIITTLENGLGDLYIDYTLEINHAVVSENKLHITIREAGSSYDKPYQKS